MTTRPTWKNVSRCMHQTCPPTFAQLRRGSRELGLRRSCSSAIVWAEQCCLPPTRGVLFGFSRGPPTMGRVPAPRRPPERSERSEAPAASSTVSSLRPSLSLTENDAQGSRALYYPLHSATPLGFPPFFCKERKLRRWLKHSKKF